MSSKISTPFCNYCAKKLTHPFITKDTQTFCNNDCLETYFNPSYVSTRLNLVAQKINENLQIEKIALSGAVVTRDENNQISVVIYEGETATKAEFAKFNMYSRPLGWVCSESDDNLNLPISYTHWLVDYLREIIEESFDDIGVLR